MYKESWLIISNCTSHGIANCLKSQSNDVSFTAIDLSEARKNADHWNDNFKHFTKVFATDEAINSKEINFGSHKLIRKLPIISTRVYHPDFIELSNSKGTIKSKAGGYNSVITYCAYKNGIEAKDVYKFFCKDIYQQAGYFLSIKSEKERIYNNYKDYGLDLKPYIHAWGRNKSFMHTINHPVIDVVYDIASALLFSENVDFYRDEFRPPDMLVYGCSVPVLPEIAEHVGCTNSSKVFRNSGSCNRVTLQEFIDYSYQAYDNLGDDDVIIPSFLKDQYETVSRIIK